jgi:hypothetical protein
VAVRCRPLRSVRKRHRTPERTGQHGLGSPAVVGRWHNVRNDRGGSVRTATRLPGRRVLGWCVAVLAVVALVGFAAGIWNPWRLVRLRQVFGDPTLGALVVLVLVLVAFWLLAPVGSEASQPVRHMIRWLLILSLLPAFFVWALGHTFFTVTYRQVATSPSGPTARRFRDPPGQPGAADIGRPGARSARRRPGGQAVRPARGGALRDRGRGAHNVRLR